MTPSPGSKIAFLFLIFLVCNIQLSLIVDSDLNSDNIPWNLAQIDITGAWNITKGHKEIIVAIIDSGVDFNHPALSHSQWVNQNEIGNNSIDDDENGFTDDTIGWDWVSNDSNPGVQNGDPIHYHGTFIAGIIAGNSEEIIGVTPNVTIMALRVVDQQSLIPNHLGVEKSVEYAVKNGAEVIVMSLDFLIAPPGLREELQKAVNRNITIIGVTGNSDFGNESIVLPGRFPEVIAVGASNSKGEKAVYSNSGDEIEILAPGGDNSNQKIKGADLGGGIRYSYGTSYAAPHVAATIAAIKSIRSNLTVKDIRNILHETATDIKEEGWDSLTGYGILNSSAALEYSLIYSPSSSVSNPNRGLFDIHYPPLIDIVVLCFIPLSLRRRKK
jgi:subtilisin family serine protease